MSNHRLNFFAAFALLALGFAAPSRAGELPGTQTLVSPHEFAALVAKLEAAVTEHKWRWSPRPAPARAPPRAG